MTPSVLATFPPEVRLQVQESLEHLYQLANSRSLTRDQAIALKQSVSMRLGVLVTRHKLKPSQFCDTVRTA